MGAEWRQTTIGELIADAGGEIKTGPFGTTLKAHEYSSSGVPVISVGEVGYGSLRVTERTPRVPNEVVTRLPEYLLREGDIVFGRKGAVDRSALVKSEEDGWFLGSDGIRLRLPSTVDRRFFAYQLQTASTRAWLFQHSTGTTMASLNQKTVARIPVVVPPLDEQRRIAHILGTLDDKIELNRRMSQTLEEMARALFRSWFVDFDPVRAKADGRDPGLPKHLADLFPDRLIDSELGEIPEGWEVGTIGKIAHVVDCLHSKKPERQESGPPMLQLANIRDDGLMDLTDRYAIADNDYAKWTSRLEAREGDCVITNVGRVGAVAQVPPGLNAALGRNMTGVRARTGFPFPTFLLEALLSRAMRDEIVRRTDAGTILNALNVRSVPLLRFVHPPIRLAAEFEGVARSFRVHMEHSLGTNATLSAARDALLTSRLTRQDAGPELSNEPAQVSR